eukprot:CAMPEP_0184643872 /NCGR_PEP_ID=MMETSP0308-20130426/689_1 /TAXON_ID=38269 /ORGANISM="Gloeochaete witrockiana, Strain SAG 46.84" /LENGTH=296 /DNA_ID=CAMNT_0027072103 /DNA_START=224 /DNA_END=1114 /DNA_ORIENTATION=+
MAPGQYGQPQYGQRGVNEPYAYPPAGVPAGPVLKRSLNIGINYYRSPQHKLNGCINDAKCMKYLLQTKFGYQESDMLMLTDEETDPLKRPTRANIINAMRWLVIGVKPGDHLFFSYSGHGSQVRNVDGQEADGMDETILPEDFQSAGQIVDNEINRMLVLSLPPGVRLTAVMDCCHSGTGLDLPYIYTASAGAIHTYCENNVYSLPNGRQGLGEAVLFSACSDFQKSADTNALSGTVSTGAATYSFIAAIEASKGYSYASLLLAMVHTLQTSRSKTQQLPQISSSFPLDVNASFHV